MLFFVQSFTAWQRQMQGHWKRPRMKIYWEMSQKIFTVKMRTMKQRNSSVKPKNHGRMFRKKPKNYGRILRKKPKNYGRILRKKQKNYGRMLRKKQKNHGQTSPKRRKNSQRMRGQMKRNPKKQELCQVKVNLKRTPMRQKRIRNTRHCSSLILPGTRS